MRLGGGEVGGGPLLYSVLNHIKTCMYDIYIHMVSCWSSINLQFKACHFAAQFLLVSLLLQPAAFDNLQHICYSHSFPRTE